MHESQQRQKNHGGKTSIQSYIEAGLALAAGFALSYILPKLIMKDQLSNPAFAEAIPIAYVVIALVIIIWHFS